MPAIAVANRSLPRFRLNQGHFDVDSIFMAQLHEEERNVAEKLLQLFRPGWSQIGNGKPISCPTFPRKRRRAYWGALRHKLCVSKALHQHDPCTCDARGVPAGSGRLA